MLERVERDRECPRAEQSEPCHEVLERPDSCGEVLVVHVFVPGHHVGFGTAESDCTLVVTQGNSCGAGRCIGCDHLARVENRHRCAGAELVFGCGGHSRPVGNRQNECAVRIDV